MTRDFDIHLHQGDDSVTLTALTGPRDLLLSGGRGDDEIVLTNVLVARDAIFRGGDGDDLITLAPITPAPGTITPVEGVDVGRLLAIDGGADIDEIALDTVVAGTYLQKAGKKDRSRGRRRLQPHEARLDEAVDHVGEIVFNNLIERYT